jgi:hypothetical protein
MVQANELEGQSKATVTSDRAQQILQAYNAYKASGGQSAPSTTNQVTPQRSSQSSSSPINISSVQLQKTNALRAQEDLPPLQEVANVRVVAPTSSRSQQPQQSVPQPEKITSNQIALGQGMNTLSLQQTQAKNEVLTTREKLAQAQGSVTSLGGGGEAVSFMRFPFSSNKGPSSGGVQSTTILDPLQFLGIEAGVSLATKGAEALYSFIRGGGGKEIVKIGTKDIGLNIKPSEAYLKAKSFETQAARLPSPASIRPTPPPKVPTLSSGGGGFTSTNINLGRGVGQLVPKEGGIAKTDLFKPSPPSSPKPSQGKEVTVGKGGLTQLVREKPVIEKPQLLTKFKEEQIKLGKGETKTLQKQTIKPVPPKLLQRQKQEPIFTPRQKQKQTKIFIPKYKQKQTYVFPIPPPKTTPVPIFTPRQKQKQGGGYPKPPPNITIPTLLIPPPPRTTPPPPRIPPPPTNTPPPPPPPDINKKLGGLIPGFNTQTGALGKVSKGGNRLGYIGNVPLTSIVGVYKRSEISYGNKAEKLSKGTKTSQNFSSLSSKGSKKFRF